MTELNELAAIYFLKRIKGLGPVKSKKIYEISHSFYDFYITYRNWITHRTESFKYLQFVNTMFTTQNSKKRFEDAFSESSNAFEQSRNYITAQTKNANQFGAIILTYFDKFYPKNLYESNQSIPLLYAKGDMKVLGEKKLCAVVGTRKPSNWTIINTEKAVKNLVKKGYVIVSGLAKGVDSIAHRTALESNGKTIAVLGSGIDVYYPSENRKLQNEIMKKGVVLSEYPFGMKVQSFSLKKRNKIIVGLSDFVLITETAPKGGTMNSYQAAVQQKKPVGIFLPSFAFTGDFEGNKQIERESKTKIMKFHSGEEIERI